MRLEMSVYVYDIACPRCGSKDVDGANQADIRIPDEVGLMAVCGSCGHEEDIDFLVTLKAPQAETLKEKDKDTLDFQHSIPPENEAAAVEDEGEVPIYAGKIDIPEKYR